MNEMQQTAAKMPRQTLAAILRAAGSARNDEDRAGVLREVGASSAEGILALFRGCLPDQELAEVPADIFWTELSHFLGELGWGSIEQDALHPGVVSIAASDWFEAEGATEGHPCCHFSTGLFAELLRIVSNVDIAAMEVECRASGDDRCLFLVGSPAALDEVYEEMMRGASASDAVLALR